MASTWPRCLSVGWNGGCPRLAIGTHVFLDWSKKAAAKVEAAIADKPIIKSQAKTLSKESLLRHDRANYQGSAARLRQAGS
jgi:hypothetical protein